VTAEVQNKLVALAKECGLQTETTNDMLVLFREGQPSEPPLAEIHLDHPQHEAIFSVLHEIGQFYIRFRNPRPLPMPWFVNRSYENEILGEAAYKVKRGIRQKCSEKWQADLWAMCAYCQIGCPDDLNTFLKQHPEKASLFYIAVTAQVKTRIRQFIRKLFHR
jgi:hypothetical protein